MITLYGASDDCIEVKGDVTEEWYLNDDTNGDVIAFSCGVVVCIEYTRNGVWRISPIVGADRVTITPAPEDDDDNYTDRLVIDEPVTWVVHGLAVAWVGA